MVYSIQFLQVLARCTDKEQIAVMPKEGRKLQHRLRVSLEQ